MKTRIAALLLLGLTSCSKPYTCAAGPNEICPSDQFVADYHRVKRLQSELPQGKIDEISGIVQRLNGQIPRGYLFDEQKLRFVVQPAPASTTAPPAAR